MEGLYAIQNNLLACDWDVATFFLFSQNVFAPFIYYSHLFPTLAGLVLSGLIFWSNWRSLLHGVLAALAVLFSLWSILDLVLWATEKPTIVMFVWSSLIYFDPLIYLVALVATYIFCFGRPPKLGITLLVLVPLIPVYILAPTDFNLIGFDYTNCDREAIEGPLWHYTYVYELFIILLLVVTIVTSTLARNNQTKYSTGEKILFGAGMFTFLLSFSWGNIVGSFTQDWSMAQYGLFGMPIFLGFLVYLMIKYKSFSPQLLSTQVLSVVIWIFIASLLFLRTIENARPIIVVTLILFTFFGGLFTRSIRKEIELRQQGEQLARYLANANARLRELDRAKTEFVSLASHQLRGPITAMQGYASIMLEGTYGTVPEYLRTPLTRIFESSRHLAIMVDDFLNVTRIEQGRMKYAQDRVDIDKLARATVEEFHVMGREKGLEFSYKQLGDLPCEVIGDEGKLKQVVSNIIDNAIKYTKTGTIQVVVIGKRENKTVELVVTDTGVGIPIEDQQKLFQKFARASNANSSNVYGTGLGLYVVKEMVKAHSGNVELTSPGSGAGTKVTVTLPMAPPAEHQKQRVYNI